MRWCAYRPKEHREEPIHYFISERELEHPNFAKKKKNISYALGPILSYFNPVDWSQTLNLKFRRSFVHESIAVT